MTNGTLTLVDALFQEAYICASVGSTSPDYNSRPGGPGFHAELFPVHSPLLRESFLVSCPPLTYMLKFSGFSYLTSCHGRGLKKAPSDRGALCTQRNRWRHETLNKLIGAEALMSSMRQAQDAT